VPVREPEATSKEWSLSADEERDVLNFDPWGERDATYRVIREGFCVVRKPHECVICFGPIATGDRVWFRTEQDNGKMKTFRFCPECCWCIAHRNDDYDWDADRWDADRDGTDAREPWARMDARWELGSRRAREREGG
jgi:hypothetical protein